MTRRWRWGLERSPGDVSRLSQAKLNIRYERVRAAEHAPRNRLDVLERSHGLAEIVERRAVVAERPPVIQPHTKIEFITFSKNASRYGYCFAKQCFGFFEAL